MKLLALIGLLAFLPEAYACRGPETEIAQERDATVLFVGEPTAYVLSSLKNIPTVTSGRIAKVSFRVAKTIKGVEKKSWHVLIRGQEIPATLEEFEKKFGRKLKVGLRDFGSRIDQEKLPKGFRGLHFVVDNSCAMNGEDWLLRKVE